MRFGRRSQRIVDGDLFRRLVRARERIDDAYDQPLSLEALAREAGVSPFHFLRCFQRVFGTTPLGYLTAVRIDRAKDLLAGRASVTETCLRVGYRSLGSFSTRFSHEVGCSPLAWQRQARRIVGVPARFALLHIPCCYHLFWLPKRKIGETAPPPA